MGLVKLFTSFNILIIHHTFLMLRFLLSLFLAALCCAAPAKTRRYLMRDMGICPGTTNVSPLMAKALADIRRECGAKDKVVLVFEPGTYTFHPTGAASREYYISNHDQTNPKLVGIALEDMDHVTIEGHGAELLFHGRMLPISVVRCNDVTLKDLHIDFATPHIAQVRVEKNEGRGGITFSVAPWVNYRLTPDSLFEHSGEGWTLRPSWGIAFEGDTRRVVYRTSDIGFNLKGCHETAPRTIHAPQWRDERLVPGTVVAMRGWGRPTPGLFLTHSTDVTVKNVQIHYAEGMGILAQLCTDIRLDGSGICLRGKDDPRYFTTQADATHFSGCRGRIVSVNGLYENMMDDAINVHGTYLKVIGRPDDHTLVGRYMHGQSWGFTWGYPGDEVQFVRSKTMELVGERARIVSITPRDKATDHGAREFVIRFDRPIDAAITEAEGFGIENLTWTPEVYFAHNTIRHNRARGALFSTPRRTVAEHNVFDHTSGTAILLCGDCNGWYETGACRDVVIRKNVFINALTSLFQFTNAIISIYPEIPDLNSQQLYFHGGKKGAIRIEKNVFDTFDAPVLYAKSVNGLTFRGNTIRQNHDFPAFHWNKQRFLLERVIEADIEE